MPSADPKISVSKTTKLNRDGETISVKGVGFSPTQTIYVAVCSDLTLPANVFMHLTKCQDGAVRVTPGADGTFTQPLPVKYGDSLASGAAIFTSADHTAMQDRSFDTKVSISFSEVAGPIDPTPTPKPTPTPTPVPKPVDPKDGSLVWGLDKVFMDYISGPIAKGTIKASNGASLSGGIFTFPQVSSTVKNGSGSVTFQGDVAFTGHNGMLDSQFKNLELKFISPSKAQLLGTVTANSMSGVNLLNNARVTIANVTLKTPVVNKDTSISFASNGVVLTADGAKLFGNYYPAAQTISELSFTIGSDAVVDPGQKPVVVPPKQVDKPKAEVTKTPPAILTPEVTKAEEVCVARSVSGATLSWGFKSTFVNYVSRLSDGSITTSGVSKSGNNFAWGGGSGKYNQDTNKGLVSLGGTVTFSGHGGVMSSKFSGMRVQFLGGNSAALIANVVANDMNGKPTTMNGVQIATISLAGKKSTSGNTVTWSNAGVTLTSAGAKAFGGFYQAGESLDSLTISVPLGGTTSCDTSTGTLASTGAEEGSVSYAAGALALVVFGAVGALVARRRKVTAN